MTNRRIVHKWLTIKVIMKTGSNNAKEIQEKLLNWLQELDLKFNLFQENKK